MTAAIDQPVGPAQADGMARWRAFASTYGVWILVVASLAAGIGMRSPSPPDEPRFVLAARTMVESGQWLLPHRGTELYAEKPPVFMWLQAISFRILHDWNLAFLVPSLLAALATLWLTHDMGRRLWGARIARHAALALFCTIQFGLMAKRAQIDMVLVAMTTLSLWGLVRHFFAGPDRVGLLVAGFAAGLGTVTKGVGFLPLLAIIPWLAARRWANARPVGGPAVQWLLLPAGFLLGAGVWLVPLSAALVATHSAELEAYAREILLRQTGTRYVASWHHVQPPWYYLQVILTLWLPGSLLLPRLVPAWQRRIRRGDGRYVVLLGWAALVLIFFSASPGKREVYILPALPALCLAAAPLLPGLLRQRYAQRVLQAHAAAIALVALALAAVLLFSPQRLGPALAGRDLDPAAIHSIAAWMLLLGGAVAWQLEWPARRAGRTVVIATALLWTAYGVGFMPALDPFASSARLMGRVEERIGPGAMLGLVDWKEQNYLQARRRPVDFGFKVPAAEQWNRALDWIDGDPAGRWLLINAPSLPDCVDRASAIDMGQSNRNTWLLVHGADVDTRRCRLSFQDEEREREHD
jgi:4-amino-4-deoxy-L-arabinose transferase-like glycosyltransferase